MCLQFFYFLFIYFFKFVYFDEQSEDKNVLNRKLPEKKKKKTYAKHIYLPDIHDAMRGNKNLTYKFFLRDIF